ncbi:replication protein, partial [Neisseria gonorrhoeae]
MKYIPNSFQIANAVVDDFLCRMSGNAWKCYAVIVRKTTGWQKEIDYISVSQFKNLTGIKTDVTVADALKELVELNLIASVKRHGQVTGYRINMPEPSPENGGTTTPKNWGSTKHTTKPTNTKHSISASAAADAPLSAEPPETAPAAKAKKTGRHETELSLLADYGITGQVAADFLQVRKA